MASPKASVKEANVCGRFAVFHTKFDSVPLFDIFLHCKRNEVRKHDHTNSSSARLAQPIQLKQVWTCSQGHYQRTDVHQRGATLRIHT